MSARAEARSTIWKVSAVVVALAAVLIVSRLVAGAAGAGGSGGGTSGIDGAGDGELPELLDAPEFRLVDQNGQAFGSRELRAARRGSRTSCSRPARRSVRS